MTNIQPIPAGVRGQSRILRSIPGPDRPERARGHARLGYVSAGGETRLAECYQSGSARIRLPRGTAKAAKEAVLLNTAGGVTGGDHLVYEVQANPGSSVVVSTQAAERVYRRIEGAARIETKIGVGTDARVDWLPQETIIFDRSALSRRLVADVAAGATLLATEAIVLGRTAMGEKAQDVRVSDTWRIHRDGRLVFADGLRLDGDADGIMAGSATGDGATALGTLLLLAPDAEARLEAARDCLAGCHGEGGASAWNGMLVARLIAPSGQALRHDLIALIERLRGVSMPRVWNC